jgi:hypothetical protein
MKSDKEIAKIWTLVVLPTLLLLLFALYSSRVKAEDAGIQDAGVSVFDTTGFYGVPWGTTKDQIEDPEYFKDDYYKWHDKNLVIVKDIKGDAITKSILMLYGFDNNRLVYGASVYYPKHNPKPEDFPLICQMYTYNLIDYLGPPSAETEAMMLWQNEDTTVATLCTNYGLSVQWYNTMWLRYNNGFIPYKQIPGEALNVLRSNE